MMNFQFEPGEGGGWDIAFLGPFVTIIFFAIPVVIFWRARTRIFFLIFSVALFWIITPVFFQAITGLLIGLTITGIVLVLVALKKGHINIKMAGLLVGMIFGAGGVVFYSLLESPEGRGAGGPREGLLPWEDTGTLLGEIGGSGLLVLILISIFSLGFFMHQKYELFDFKKDDEEKKEIESDVSSAVDKAIRDLIEGKDIESTILECYNQMSLILEEKGIRDEEHMTPREFEKAANDTLNVTTSKISRIREIFEVAKYSSQKLEEEDKEKVIKDLEALKEELG